MIADVDVAQVCHEANRAWRQVVGEDPGPHWEESPQWLRGSAVEGVVQARSGLDAKALHEAWRESKTADGWTWGPVKDVESKKHPCLVPYEDLDEDQKRKDSLFLAVVMALTRPV